jgi:hypothetical protein
LCEADRRAERAEKDHEKSESGSCSHFILLTEI